MSDINIGLQCEFQYQQTKSENVYMVVDSRGGILDLSSEGFADRERAETILIGYVASSGGLGLRKATEWMDRQLESGNLKILKLKKITSYVR